MTITQTRNGTIEWRASGAVRGLLAAWALGAGMAIGAEPARFGLIEWVSGPVDIVNAHGQSRPARASEPVVSGETVQTGRGGELHLRTEDSAFVAIRQNSQVRIDSYLASGKEGDHVAMSLLHGALRSVTGWIGRKNPAGYRLRTPTATIGIRGTDHETHYVPPHAGTDPNLPAAGTYDKVNSGGTTLRNAGGEIAIGPNQSAHAPHDGRTQPRLLERAPAIFRPGMNDARIDMRKAELAREVEARLQERGRDPKDLKELKELKDSKDGREAGEAKDAAREAKDRAGRDEGTRKAPDRVRRKSGDR
ncbi:MAG: FecR domain-containing protein [Betaproteobacteria bacterium]|nr:FecR domain-containing protein [Betaproteobacteria bacterium]